jgi:hypothetical protein
VTGLQQPRQNKILLGGESAKGGSGIPSTSTQRSNPLASATHWRADTATITFSTNAEVLVSNFNRFVGHSAVCTYRLGAM